MLRIDIRKYSMTRIRFDIFRLFTVYNIDMIIQILPTDNHVLSVHRSEMT